MVLNRSGCICSFLFLLIFTLSLKAHPGPGIVKDSKGNIYYTDLVHVWKISPDGHKTIAVSRVHTHKLYIDQNDIIYGENMWYNGERVNTWGCYEWRLHPSGKLDTIFGPAPAFQNEYTLDRDASGNQYYVQHQPVKKFFRINTDGSLTKLGEGRYNSLVFTLVTPDGNWYFTSENNLYRLDTLGQFTTLAKNIGSATLSHSGNFKDPYLVGLWADRQQNIYVADFSGQKVKRVNPQGKVDIIAHSTSPWSPVGGLIDDQDNFWLLENDVVNRVQVRKITIKSTNPTNQFKAPVWNNGLPLALLALFIGSIYWIFFRKTKVMSRE